MKLCKRYAALTLSCLAIWTCTSTARALMIAPQPGPTRVIHSDVVVVGRVVALEPQDVTVDNANYRIAIVQVEQALRGGKDAKNLRVAFIPPPMNVGKPGGPIIRGGFRSVQLQPGNDGLFLLKKHAKENFYTLGGPAGFFISSENNKNFGKEVQAVKTVVRLMEAPQAGLKSKDADERLLAAAILIEMYRGYSGPGTREEPIVAEESKLILHALGEADWKAPADIGGMRPNPQQLFGRLGVTPNDGWRPQPGTDFATAAQNWVREHADTYRIKRFIVERQPRK